MDDRIGDPSGLECDELSINQAADTQSVPLSQQAEVGRIEIFVYHLDYPDIFQRVGGRQFRGRAQRLDLRRIADEELRFDFLRCRLRHAPLAPVLPPMLRMLNVSCRGLCITSWRRVSAAGS